MLEPSPTAIATTIDTSTPTTAQHISTSTSVESKASSASTSTPSFPDTATMIRVLSNFDDDEVGSIRFAVIYFMRFIGDVITVMIVAIAMTNSGGWLVDEYTIAQVDVVIIIAYTCSRSSSIGVMHGMCLDVFNISQLLESTFVSFAFVMV
jgi:hypothetical protein